MNCFFSAGTINGASLVETKQSDKQQKLLRLYQGGTIYRTLDLRFQTSIVIQKPFGIQPQKTS